MLFIKIIYTFCIYFSWKNDIFLKTNQIIKRIYISVAKKEYDKTSLPMDYSIKSNKIRLVNEDGSNTIMQRDAAIEVAHSRGMQLVQIAFNPSVFPGSICKIIDYAKFKYDEKKRQKEIQKRNKASQHELKEIKFTIRIDDGDKKMKIDHIREFIDNGNPVKVTIFLSKREMNRIDYAKDLMKSILSCFDGIARIDGAPSMEGRQMSCVLKKMYSKL